MALQDKVGWSAGVDKAQNKKLKDMTPEGHMTEEEVVVVEEVVDKRSVHIEYMVDQELGGEGALVVHRLQQGEGAVAGEDENNAMSMAADFELAADSLVGVKRVGECRGSRVEEEDLGEDKG